MVQNVNSAYTIDEQAQRRKQVWHVSNWFSLLAFTEIPIGKAIHS